MSEAGTTKAREQMGRSLGAWVASPVMSHQVLKGSWHFLSGFPSPAVNMAMVHVDDSAALDETLKAISNMNTPAVLFLAAAGKNLSGRLLDEWSQVGLFTLMSKDLIPSEREFDRRVSLAGADDVEAVTQLLADSFIVELDTFRFLIDMAKDPLARADTWVLKVDGVAVSTVTTILVDGALAVWCMATPPQFARRGYGKALLDDVLARSEANGVETGLLSASKAGKPLYDASGWESLEEWDVYLNGSANH